MPGSRTIKSTHVVRPKGAQDLFKKLMKEKRYLQRLKTTTNKADFSQFFYCHKRHTATHTCIYGGDTGHTHTNTRRPEVAVKCTLCIWPIPDHPSSRTLQEQWAASQRPGTKWTVRLGQGRTGVHVLCLWQCCFREAEIPLSSVVLTWVALN